MAKGAVCIVDSVFTKKRLRKKMEGIRRINKNGENEKDREKMATKKYRQETFSFFSFSNVFAVSLTKYL